MRLHRRTVLLSALLLATGTVDAARAHEAGGPASLTAGTSTTEATTASATGASVTTASDAEANARIEAIRSRGAAVPASRRDKIESRITSTRIAVDREAELNGATRVAARLGREFNVSAEGLITTEARHGCGWGELMIAHTLAANGNGGANAMDLLRLRESRVGWAQIAAGMGLRLEDVVAAVKAESRVARGTLEADGKVAIVRGEGSIHDLPPSLTAGSEAKAGAAGIGADLKTGASASFPPVKVGH